MVSTAKQAMLAAGRLCVTASGVDSFPAVTWDAGEPEECTLSLRLDFRTGGAGGGMCDLFKLNVLLDPLPVATVGHGECAGAGRRSVRFEGGAEGLRVLSEASVAADDTLTVRVVLRKESGPARRYQVLAEQAVHAGAPEAESMALVLPRPGGGLVLLRPTDPCGQELMDQAVPHLPFERTVRLAAPHGLLARPEAGRGLLFSGDPLHWVRAWRNRYPGRYQFVMYGRDAWLEQGDEWVQWFTWQPVAGIGGLGGQREDVESGLGALLARGQVIAGDQLPVYVTAPEQTVATKILLSGDGTVQRACEGQGSLTLDLSGLPDGAYEVRKQVTSGGRLWEGCEPLLVRRDAWRAIHARAGALREYLAAAGPVSEQEERIVTVRRDLLRWKLDQVERYQRYHEERQVTGLLADGERIRQALEQAEPADLSATGATLYEHDLKSDQDDFEIFGAADLSFDPRGGMEVRPVGTTNFWSRFHLDGDYRMDIEYYPQPADRGGFMVTFCGEAVNPVSQYSLMPSASLGSMDHYKFFTRTYHWSLVPGRRTTRVRKTGRGFYILSEVEDVLPALETWYRLAIVKRGNQFLFAVDGCLVQEVFDIGAQGPFLDSGRVGFRFWSGSAGRLRNLRIRRLGSGQS